MTGLFQPGVREPLIREIKLPADIHTCYGRILACSPYSAFLNSGTDLPFARWNFIGCDPYVVFRSTNGRQTIELPTRATYRDGDPFRTLSEIFDSVVVETDWNEAPFFAGGIGAFGYDLGHHVERLPRRADDDLKLPDLVFSIYKTILIHDRFENRTWLSTVSYGEKKDSAGEAERCMDRVLGWMSEPVDSPGHGIQCAVRNTEPRSNFSKKQYVRAVKKCLDYIHAGDIYQVNLSQRFSAGMKAAPYEYFLKLSEINPAPFGAYIDCDTFQIISSSPERFLKTTGRTVETRPIKGTRPRGLTPQEDTELANELLNSEKDNAELAMIVDLERNDLGRVCEFGTVKVTRDRELEPYATVNHLVATVEGKMRSGVGPSDLLRATFPGGSITGCPKIRSMEIIDELEPTRRGFYTGSIGYIGFNGDMDLNIVIRTLIARGAEVYYNVGGGIVADSDPEAEYQETLDKGMALAAALERVNSRGSGQFQAS